MILYRCESSINDIQKIFELKYKFPLVNGFWFYLKCDIYNNFLGNIIFLID